MDPCEKDPTDAASNLTNQEREDITASAQVCMILFSSHNLTNCHLTEHFNWPKQGDDKLELMIFIFRNIHRKESEYTYFRKVL